MSLQLISLLLILSSKLRKISLPLRYALANGVAESLNRRLMVRTPAMKRQASLPNRLWAEGIYSSVWLKNGTSTKALESVTPYERGFIEKSPSCLRARMGAASLGL